MSIGNANESLKQPTPVLPVPRVINLAAPHLHRAVSTGMQNESKSLRQPIRVHPVPRVINLAAPHQHRAVSTGMWNESKALRQPIRVYPVPRVANLAAPQKLRAVPTEIGNARRSGKSTIVEIFLRESPRIDFARQLNEEEKILLYFCPFYYHPILIT